STTSLAPSVRSRISWPILLSARRISSAPRTGLGVVPAINGPPSPSHGTGFKGRRTSLTYQEGQPDGTTEPGVADCVILVTRMPANPTDFPAAHDRATTRPDRAHAPDQVI